MGAVAMKSKPKGQPRQPAHGTKPLPQQLAQLNLNAAGIDVGSRSHFVAVSAGRDEPCVRAFGAFTEDLYRLGDWLKACGIETVVMESTGV
jgi:transposase